MITKKRKLILCILILFLFTSCTNGKLVNGNYAVDIQNNNKTNIESSEENQANIKSDMDTQINNKSTDSSLEEIQILNTSEFGIMNSRNHSFVEKFNDNIYVAYNNLILKLDEEYIGYEVILTETVDTNISHLYIFLDKLYYVCNNQTLKALDLTENNITIIAQGVNVMQFIDGKVVYAKDYSVKTDEYIENGTKLYIANLNLGDEDELTELSAYFGTIYSESLYYTNGYKEKIYSSGEYFEYFPSLVLNEHSLNKLNLDNGKKLSEIEIDGAFAGVSKNWILLWKDGDLWKMNSEKGEYEKIFDIDIDVFSNSAAHLEVINNTEEYIVFSYINEEVNIIYVIDFNGSIINKIEGYYANNLCIMDNYIYFTQSNGLNNEELYRVYYDENIVQLLD